VTKLAKRIFGTRGVVWSRRIKGFWEEYSHNKIGLAGLGILSAYIFVAIFAPLLTPYDPITTKDIADGYAVPEWMTFFSQYKHLPRTMEMSTNWIVTEASDAVSVKNEDNKLVVLYNGTGSHSINLTSIFLYPYRPTDKFLIDFEWWAEDVSDAQYRIELFIMNPAGSKFSMWSYPPMLFSPSNTNWTSFTLYSTTSELLTRLGLPWTGNVANEVFNEVGEYKLQLQMQFISDSTTSGTAKIHYEITRFKIFGLAHGLLGTDSAGRDIFCQVIFGSQISLAIGLTSALLSTFLGIFVGVVAGYVGGFADEGLMRTVDILLCLPVLPILLALISLFGTSVWYLVMLIALFGWLGLSRLIRSVVLSLKEMPFIECARAAGASKFYIMVRHMVPNVLPVALAALVLAVPAAILTEAAISFIGLGDPSTPSWGRMLNYAFTLGGFRDVGWLVNRGVKSMAWWWIIPPGLAITIITLGFVFVGHAVDEVINPRLRRRR